MQTNPVYDKKFFVEAISRVLVNEMDIEPAKASDEQFYRATATVLREMLSTKRKRFIASENSQGHKQVDYMSMEFLMGRSLKNTIYNEGIVEPVKEALAEMDVKLEKLYQYEPDPGLGNGGLGRLAACYLDALATDGYPAMGYSILYEYGIFKQKIIDGWQTELPDYWLPGGEVWLDPVPEHTVQVRFGGELEERWDDDYHSVVHKNYSTVNAVPYNMYVSGYGNKGVSVLRLCSAKSPGIDMERFNRGDYLGAFGQNSMHEVISKVLYPNDNHPEGKSLRLRQQYFLVAASVSDIIRRHMSVYGSMDNLPEKCAIHINDTHPTLAIPEMMRLLLDECGYEWDQAWDIVSRTFAYTNHTVMAEALECWNETLLKTLLPRIHQIICEINRRFCQNLKENCGATDEEVNRMTIVKDHSVRMASLAVVGSHSVNGVSALHSQIIKDSVFNDYYRYTPAKFTNVTNGIASRRWLMQANPGLTQFISDRIGPDYLGDFAQLEELKKFADDKASLNELAAVKRANKERFAKHLAKLGVTGLDPDSIFDVQVKRLHEYKRQALNGMDILNTYLELKDNPNMDFVPRTYIFGAKAAPGYFLAKQTIKFLCGLRDLIDADPVVSKKMKMVYLEEYNVTMSEMLCPAADISQQISLAGTEASGTGNMKLMLSGAVTMGTLDGANIEIAQAAGMENEIIFGMTTPEVEELKRKGYNPTLIYNNNDRLRRCVDFLTNTPGFGPFNELGNSLHYNDPYMVLADFEAYRAARAKSAELYKKPEVWQKMSLMNVASSGIFCADRAVEEYARNIWNLK